jgi:predicted molibdopterin-dependent oxidoreductase YjgC
VHGTETTITVDGERVRTREGVMLLETLRSLGIELPTLCNDPRLTPYGGCRLCVVARRDSREGLVPACATPVQRGMVIDTHAPEVIESRRRQLQLLALNHRMECPVCESRGDCRLQELISLYGSPEEPLPFDRRPVARDERSPVIIRDPEKCIVCGRCVRICDEVQGVAAIGFVDRGLDTRVSTAFDRPLDCEFCGQCVNACPVGALVARPYLSSVPVWQRDVARTTCSFCSCGCQVEVETHAGRLLRVTSDPETLPNHGKLCVKGWLGWDVLESPERLQQPLLRSNGRLVHVEWEEALEAVALAMREARRSARAIVGIGSSRMTCEDAYLMQRFLRGVVGTPHVDVGPVGGVSALVEGLGEANGAPHSTATLEQMAEADVVLVLRGDPTRTHPLVKTELVQGARQRGQQLILAHALSGGLERHATLFLPLEAGTEDVLVNGVASEVLRLRPPATAVLGDLPGFADWASSIGDYTPPVVSGCTGVPAGKIVQAAEMLATARKVVTVVVTGLGIPGDEARVTRAAVRLMSLLGRAEADRGVLVLGENANVQGVLDVGLHSGLLPGHRMASDASALADLRTRWGGELPAGPGWTAKEALARAARGEVHVLQIVGQDPLAAWPQGYRARRAVDGAAFVVVHDAFLTKTARHADVVLPVRILGDREGTVVGADGVRRAVRPVRDAPDLPQDGELFVELARRLGVDLPRGEKLEQELVRLRLWPHGKVPVRRYSAISPPIRHAAAAGMLLDVSPQLFHCGSVTKHSRMLQELAPTLVVRICPDDAEELAVRDGDPVRVAAGERELLLRARLDRAVRKGTVIVPWQRGDGDSVSMLMQEVGPPLVVSVRRSR